MTFTHTPYSYLIEKGEKCPKCGSPDIDWSYDMGNAQELDDQKRPTGRVTIPATCYGCGFEYSEIYQLIGYRPYEDGVEND